MNRTKFVIPVLCLFLVSAPILADVKMQEKSLVKFSGFMGKMMGLFGGKTARDGVVSSVAVKGNRKMTTSDYGSQLIDLDEQKVYDIDTRKKTYKVTTFEQLRQEMAKARAEAEKAAGQKTSNSGEPAKEFEIDFELKETGERKKISGHDAREILMTVTVREKGRTLEEAGGLVLTAHSWLAPRIDSVQEVAEFDRKFAEALAGPSGLNLSAQDMAALFAFYPGLGEALGKFSAENVNLDGTSVLTQTTVESVAAKGQSAQQTDQAEEKEEAPASVGGLLGGFAKRMGKKKESEPAAQKDPSRATVLTMSQELLGVSSAVADADVAVPSGFKEKR